MNTKEVIKKNSDFFLQQKGNFLSSKHEFSDLYNSIFLSKTNPLEFSPSDIKEISAIKNKSLTALEDFQKILSMVLRFFIVKKDPLKFTHSLSEYLLRLLNDFEKDEDLNIERLDLTAINQEFKEKESKEAYLTYKGLKINSEFKVKSVLPLLFEVPKKLNNIKEELNELIFSSKDSKHELLVPIFYNGKDRVFEARRVEKINPDYFYERNAFRLIPLIPFHLIIKDKKYKLNEISREGLSFYSNEDVFPDEDILEFTLDKNIILRGSIKYTTLSKKSYLVGIQFIDETNNLLLLQFIQEQERKIIKKIQANISSGV